jgi:hypothetical protein
MRYRLLLLAALFCISLAPPGHTQTVESTWNPSVAYTWKSSDRVTFKSELDVVSVLSNLSSNQFISYIEPKFSFAYGLSVRTKIGGGYYYRRVDPFSADPGYEHRTLQQLGLISYVGDRRIAHRFRLEQRIRSSSYQNRFRYRLSYDLPLQGQLLDPGEAYLTLSNEVMTAFNAEKYDFENRALMGIGWYINRKRKTEFSVQYRTQDIGSSSGLNHLFQISTGLYFNR